MVRRRGRRNTSKLPSPPEADLREGLLPRQAPAASVGAERGEGVLLLRGVGQAEAVEEDEQRKPRAAIHVPLRGAVLLRVARHVPRLDVRPWLEDLDVGDHGQRNAELFAAHLVSWLFDVRAFKGAAGGAGRGGEDEDGEEESGDGGDAGEEVRGDVGGEERPVITPAADLWEEEHVRATVQRGVASRLGISPVARGVEHGIVVAAGHGVSRE